VATRSQVPPKLPFSAPRDRDTYRAAQKAVRQHVAAADRLARLHVLRTGRAVQSDFAEWIVSKLLHVKLAPNTVQRSYDATDRTGAKYQIKSRITASLERPTSFDFRAVPKGFDYLVSVFFDDQFRVLGIARSPRSVVVRLGSLTSSRFSFRWNRRTRANRRVEWIVPRGIDAA